MAQRTCNYCSSDISGANALSKYCSSRCRNRAAWERKPRATCVACGRLTGLAATAARGREVRCRPCTRESEHGTYAMYAKRGCRCDECKAGAAARMREYYQRRKAEGRPLKGGARHKRDLVCEHCGSDFRAESARQRFCSRACFGGSKRKVCSTELVHVGPKPEPVAPPVPVTVVSLPKWWGVIVSGPCAWCGEAFTACSGSARYCSSGCSARASRARRGEFVVPPRFRYAIYQRDDWTCQLCLEPVERDGDEYRDWAPSLDHVVPRSKGGSDGWENLRLAHRWCNAVRGAEDYHSDLFGEVERVAS